MLTSIIKPLFIISRYNEELTWINDYPNDCVIYNKGPEIQQLNLENNTQIIDTDNIGGNQRDIFKFIVDNYESLPELMAFIQAYPFDHCKKGEFDKLIHHTSFTPLEWYGRKPANSYERRTLTGGFLEVNNNWYINSHNKTHNQTCIYSSFDQFMNKYFTNYHHLNWLRFSPGSQYLVEKKQILKYKRVFWIALLNELTKNSMTEGHIIERALWYILKHKYRVRETYE